jgi:uncharacterized membrane protein YfcA
MDHPLAYLLLFIASIAAAMVNSVAGGGSLISFPALIAVGQPPIFANATNTAAICCPVLFQVQLLIIVILMYIKGCLLHS